MLFKFLFKKEVGFIFIISFLTYLLFFYNFFTPNYYFWGSDAEKKHIPARFYLYEKIVEERTFPFWTERAFLGFPIYADFENAYLHPVNVASIILFGPMWSYKILHCLFYLVGSFSLYFFLKRKRIGYLGFTAANLIFFFSTFLINHQIHFNVVLSLYLLPTSVLLTDLFIEKRKILYIFLQSLVLANSILLGHPQSLLLIYLVSFTYLLVNLEKVKKIRILFFYTLLVGVFCFSLSAFQLIPTYNLFTNSYREETFRYTQGSLTPQMIIFTFIPYLFGYFDNFSGKKIDADFSYTEIYVYIGITTSILAFLSLLSVKSKKIFVFSYILFFIFLILAFLSSSDLISNDFILISLFRYWVRSVILVVFVASYLTAYLFSNLAKKSLVFDKKTIVLRLKFLVIPLIYYFYMLFQSLESRTANEVFKFLRYNLDVYPFYIILFFLVFATLSLLFLSTQNKFKINPLFVKFLILLLLFLDLRFFASDVLNLRLQDISLFKYPLSPKEIVNKRVLPDTGFSQMEYLYTKYWTPYGYSQFIDSNYVNFLHNSGIKNERAYVENVMANGNLTEKSGIDYVYIDNKISKIDEKSLPRNILNLETPFENLILKEGFISFEYISADIQKIRTFIKYDKNWSIKINGKSYIPERRDIFLFLTLPKGVNKVEITYVPNDFYIGLLASTVSLFFLFLFYFKFSSKVLLLMR